MNERAIAQYCRRVGKKLKCGRAQRKRLLGGLAQELSERFGDSPVTQEELLAQVGTPAAAAELLQESVEPEEQAAFENRQRRTWIAVAASAVVLLTSVLIGYIVYLKDITPVYYKETIVIDSPYAANQPTIDESIIWED